MNVKIFLHCFVIMSALALTTFFGEYIIRPQLEIPQAKAHAYFPVSSFPALLKTIIKTPNEDEEAAVRIVRLSLKGGKTVEGKFLSEQDGWVELKINGDEVGFHRSEIEEMQEL